MITSQEKLDIDIGVTEEDSLIMVASPDDRLEVDFQILLSQDNIDLLEKSFVSRESLQVKTIDGLDFYITHFMGDDKKPAVSVKLEKDGSTIFFLIRNDVRELLTSLFHMCRE